MRDIPFVDAHVHFWDLSHLSYAWLTPPFTDEGVNGNVEAIAHDYGPGEYRADAQGWTLAGAVHVDAGADASQSLAETDWLETLGDEAGLPTGIVAFAALEQRDVREKLAAQADRPRVRGIRQIVNHHPDPNRTYQPFDLTQSEDWRRGFAALAEHGLSFDLQIYPHQLGGLAPFLAEHDDVFIVLNHAGMAFADERDAWQEAMIALAPLPHVSVKLSGFGITDHDWTEDSIRPLILRLLDLFGPKRLLAASDVPTDKLHGSFDRCLSAYASILSDLSDDEKRDVWGRNANRVYRLGLDL
ncbi:amidohydrolase family protein [Parvularcula dongshanensis]|uniref:Putative TIM-barrel fold metal-dependent hydrolase n=1 Tax=Parvularcula dongshanensis TaxID=1173995 RepID=A0A840I6D1_9PROT|nr:putative TIM-barrel fold metal-dependent hydrolase [Parvularcula dongshanensis]